MLSNLKLKDYVMIAMGITIAILLLMLEYCNPPVGTKYINRTLIDSIISKSHIDTAYIKVPYVKYVTVDKEPEVIKEYKDTCLDLKTQKYTNNISDSLITGSIETVVTGTLDSLKLDYTINYPVVTKTDSIFMYTTKYKRPVSLVLGVDIGGNAKQFILEPSIGISTNKGYTYSLGYDISQKTISAGFKKLIPLQK